MRKSKTPANQPVEVDIVSDFVCPWCWLGYKHFLAAADKTKPRPNLSFRPYMLDASVPEDGADYRDYMKNKFGDKPDSRWKARGYWGFGYLMPDRCGYRYGPRARQRAS